MNGSAIGTRTSPAALQCTTQSWKIANVIQRLVARIRLERRIRRATAELSALDDRLLADIGISRGQIECPSRHCTRPIFWNDGVPLNQKPKTRW